MDASNAKHFSDNLARLLSLVLLDTPLILQYIRQKHAMPNSEHSGVLLEVSVPHSTV